MNISKFLRVVKVLNCLIPI